jgi:CubicO group peptidase (beta-lactamase class C family)
MQNSLRFLFPLLVLFLGLHWSCGQDNQTVQNAPDALPTPTEDAAVTVVPNPFGDGVITSQRLWFARGEEPSSLSGLDDLLETFMKTNNVHAAQLAVLKNGVILYNRTFTWAEPGYRITEPTNAFRLASCSKMFLEQAIQTLYDSGQLSPDTKVYPLLGFSGPMDLRSDDITIQQCLDHQAGFDRIKSNFDPVFKMRDIAKSLGLSRPVTKRDVASYMYKDRMLDFDPGRLYCYSNYGYLLAGMVVEQLSGLSFIDYVNQKILQPAGLAPVHLTTTEEGTQPPDEPLYEDDRSGLTADPSSNQTAPAAYGGDQVLYDVDDSALGIACPAAEVGQFIHLYKVWGNGTRAQLNLQRGHYRNRDGSMHGTSSWAESRGDDVDWVCVFNTRDFLDKYELATKKPPKYEENQDQKLPVEIDKLLNQLAL